MSLDLNKKKRPSTASGGSAAHCPSLVSNLFAADFLQAELPSIDNTSTGTTERHSGETVQVEPKKLSFDLCFVS